jgi:hypothetical protein
MTNTPAYQTIIVALAVPVLGWMTCIGTAIIVDDMRKVRARRRHGIITTGVVTRIYEDRGDNTWLATYASVNFLTTTGETRTFKLPVTSGHPSAVNDIVTVRYDPLDPTNVEEEQHTPPYQWIFLAPVVLILWFIIVGTLLTLLGLMALCLDFIYSQLFPLFR